jgi:coenzyme F420 hydrogenase subunit beta
LGTRQNRHSFYDIDPKVCTLCGACASICPIRVIAMEEERPFLEGECISCGLCYRFCPGREMDFGALSQSHLGSASQDPLFGYYRSLAVGRADSEATRRRGASGGVVTALLIHLLEERQIKGAVAVLMSKERPWQYEVSLLTTIRELKGAAQSKYSLVSLDALLGQARKQDGPFAVVGLPCHVHGLRRLQKLGSFRDKFPLVIGLFCGFNLRPAATGYLIQKLGFKKEQVTHLEYRGGAWPGGFLIQDRDGRQGYIPKSWYAYVNLMYVPRRCLTCPDLTNELADISVGDMWLEEYAGGWSTLITRSARGEDVLREAALRGVIRVTDISRDDILRSHTHLFAYKKDGYFVRQKWLRVPLNYRLERPAIGKTRWLQQSLFLASILILSNAVIRGLVQRLPLALLGRVSSWGRKGAKLAGYRTKGPKLGK